MKNIISFAIIIILSACSSMETQNIKLNSVVTDREKQIVEYEKDFRRLLGNNWKQEKLFKHEDLSCCYDITLYEDKSLQGFSLRRVYCDVSKDKECTDFLKIAKQTIIDSFINKNSPIQKKLPLRFHLCFGSKEGNKIFTDSMHKDKG